MSTLKTTLASLALVTGAVVALSAPVWAGDEKGKEEKNETIVIKIVKTGDKGNAAEMAKHHKMAMIMEHCGDGVKAIDTQEETKTEDGVKHSRVIICSKDGSPEGAGHALTALEKARERVAGITELSGESKAKALAAIDQEIARMKGTSN